MPDEKNECPEWCVSKPHSDLSDMHFSDVESVPLGTMEPKSFVDCLTGDESWSPAVLEVYLQQNTGATWPTVALGLAGGDGKSMLKLTPTELIDLVGVLTVIRDGILRRTYEAADRSAEAREPQEVPA